MTEHGFKTVQDRIADNIIAEIPTTIHLGYDYTREALAIETDVRDALKALPPSDFEGVLHPVFEEDELKLILVGAFLALGVALIELFYVFKHFKP